jgi:hypothetical protein
MKYERSSKKPVSIVESKRSYSCVICGEKTKSFNEDISDYICSDECSRVMKNLTRSFNSYKRQK